MNARIFIGNDRVDAVAADDRGLAYGDGLFETLRIHRGSAPWWDRHWARLSRGAERLRLPLPAPEMVRDQAWAMMAGNEAGVLKLILTRGSGGRGYALPATAVPTWILSTHALPPKVVGDGLSLRWCDTRLSIQPALAGLKHCNRLEQVLARAECGDPAHPGQHADEGLMLDTEQNVIGATAANLFVMVDGQWATPRIDRCGIAGVCRSWVLPELQACETRLTRAQVESAQAVFLCNAVRGILPVARLGESGWALHPQVSALRDRLAAAVPMFAPHNERIANA
ncbi:4-amino-4-deoxychorismate lyase [Luteimonas cucumeris]|uniref:Aminodeoxychorismate lyase n=1 Tax=Luteimonas cucumeris TaxID=985012 RepID=A0A562L790_9GAMM|nr:aminodeoxychorismate lyase [Luteimonas cucumeris]TWI03491.1 4-amino-4-deoxychorismate lyase [Luteimonas cucumeris]